MSPNTLAIAYLLAGVLFIFGLKGLTSPATARRGNYTAILGMVIAVAATLSSGQIRGFGLIWLAIVIGAVIGVALALKIKMTAMPQLVALLHSFVGLAAVLVAIGTYLNRAASGDLTGLLMAELAAGTVIGAITFTGSIVAFGKLQGLFGSAPLVFRGQHWLNLAIAVAIAVLGYNFVDGNNFAALMLLTCLSFALGVLLIVPIGGADMPVVVSMLNSYSGWAAAATGFTLNNNLLIVTGALVGFSGAILSYIMCRAMNRGFISVILGGFGVGDEEGGGSAVADAAERGVNTAGVDDAAYWMGEASKILVVPGYGMAVAQAQHAIKEMMDVLELRGITMKFAIHPVAGRMPGHMNVLLAEADIPYDHVFEMDDINPEFGATDVALVVGANDVTNPAAKEDPNSSIYGMPILDVVKARQIFVIKRSMRPGYAGVDNLLYYKANCALVFGDAKDVCEALTTSVRAL